MRDNRPDGASHIPVLVKVFNASFGPVLELGAGPFSTPVLHALCADKGRKLITYENNKEYYDRFKRFATDTHEIILIDDWDKAETYKEHWGMAFVDHAPAQRRANEVKYLRNITGYVVVHDTDPKYEKDYQFSGVFDAYRYRCDYTKLSPHTTVLSDAYDPSFING